MTNKEKLTEEAKELLEAAKPLLIYMNEKHHPHKTIILTASSVELVEGNISIPKIYDFIKD